MSAAPLRLALFTALLLAVFGGAALAGGAIDHEGAAEDAPAAHEADAPAAHGAEPAAHEAETLPGLAASDQGLTLVIERTTLRRGRDQIALQLVGEDGEPVRDLEVDHERRMHLIVVRRDGANFQHLHPREGADGTWTATADTSLPGTYRVFADVTRAGEQQTLGADVQVPGAFVPQAVPDPSPRAVDDHGLPVTLTRDGDRFSFSVDAELEPYLGAKGHLVVLREGDLAYLHSHPEGDELAFDAHLPTAGRYRLWVQYKIDGDVHTAAFTVRR